MQVENRGCSTSWIASCVGKTLRAPAYSQRWVTAQSKSVKSLKMPSNPNEIPLSQVKSQWNLHLNPPNPTMPCHLRHLRPPLFAPQALLRVFVTALYFLGGGTQGGDGPTIQVCTSLVPRPETTHDLEWDFHSTYKNGDWGMVNMTLF